MAERVLYHANGADVSIGNATLLNGFEKVRTPFSKIFGVTANPRAGKNAPDQPIVVDWVTLTGSQWVYFYCGDFDCDIEYNIVGRL